MNNPQIENILFKHAFTSSKNSKILNDAEFYLSIIKLNNMNSIYFLEKSIEKLKLKKVNIIKFFTEKSKDPIKDKMFNMLNENIKISDLKKILLLRKKKINEGEEFYLTLTSNNHSQIEIAINKVQEILKSEEYSFLSSEQVKDLRYFFHQGHKYIGLGKSGVQFLTKENDYFHFQSFSSDQATWINAICGNDKKLRNDFVNELNLNLCLSNIGMGIPYISTIDTDGSGESYIDTLYSSINDSNKNKLKKYYLGEKNININPFDIYFNTTTPNMVERKVIFKIFDLIFDITENEIIKDELYNEIVEKLYRVKKYYIKGKCKKIDDILSKLDITNEKISWRTLCDIFIKNDLEELSFLSHKNSMPVIDDLIDLFEMKKIKRANYFLEKYNLNNKLKKIIQTFSFFNKVTDIDMKHEDTLVIYSLKNIPSSIRELPYLMLALYDFKKKAVINKTGREHGIKLYKDDINRCNQPSRICLNDVDKIKNGSEILNFIMIESRKYIIDITLTIDNLENITKANQLYLTSIFIIGELNQGNKEYLINNNYISDIDELLINKKENETSIFSIFDTIHGMKAQSLIWLSSPTQYWTYTSDFYEVKLKDKLSLLWTGEKIRSVLSKKYPKGLSNNLLSLSKVDEIVQSLLIEK